MAFGCEEVAFFKEIFFMFNGCQSADGSLEGRCNESTDYWFSAHPNDYIFKIKDESEKYRYGMCAFAMRKNQAEFFVMGNTFMKGYYAMFKPLTYTSEDEESPESLSFIGQKGGVKSDIFAGAVPAEYFAEE